MSYQWIDASTAEGRERLKERTNKGIIVARMAFAPDEIGQCYWMDMSRLNLCGEIVRNWEEAEAENYADDGRSILDCIEFLDPEPRHKSEDQCQLEARIRTLESTISALEADSNNANMNCEAHLQFILTLRSEVMTDMGEWAAIEPPYIPEYMMGRYSILELIDSFLNPHNVEDIGE